MIQFNEFSVLLLELNSPDYSLVKILQHFTQMHNPNIKIHSVHLPFLKWGGGGELSLQPNFQKRGPDKTLTFRGGLLGKRG